jgi:proteasome accessory factor B
MTRTQTTAASGNRPRIPRRQPGPSGPAVAPVVQGAPEPDAPDYARIHRILKIIALIQGQKGWNAKKLAEECAVTQRTIYRDLDMLEGAGIPYFYDPTHKCYQIRRDFFMRPVELTLDEALSLIALGEHIGGQEQVPFTRAATQAVAKIRSLLPDSMQTALKGLDDRLAIKLAATQSPHGISDVYKVVCDALAKRKALRCRYESLAGTKKADTFLFKPYTLFFNQRAWYVVGHHDGHNEVRCLKLNRFAEIKLTDQGYEIPGTFSLKKHLGNAWRMIRGPRRYDVELLFDKEFAETIGDTHWHDTQEIDWQDDGSIIFRCQVDGLDEIVWWLLSMGPHCTVKAPVELAQQVRALAAQMVALYPQQ